MMGSDRCASLTVVETGAAEPVMSQLMSSTQKRTTKKKPTQLTGGVRTNQRALWDLKRRAARVDVIVCCVDPHQALRRSEPIRSFAAAAVVAVWEPLGLRLVGWLVD